MTNNFEKALNKLMILKKIKYYKTNPNSLIDKLRDWDREKEKDIERRERERLRRERERD